MVRPTSGTPFSLFLHASPIIDDFNDKSPYFSSSGILKETQSWVKSFIHAGSKNYDARTVPNETEGSVSSVPFIHKGLGLSVPHLLKDLFILYIYIYKEYRGVRERTAATYRPIHAWAPVSEKMAKWGLLVLLVS